LIFASKKKLFAMCTRKGGKKEKKEFDALAFMRKRRRKINKETEGMHFAELKRYFERKGK